ncbi:phosphoglycerate kinase [Bradymonas sediminis]|uniref:Phosphoglycerate kinase n=1 Tax=Bradymonas sediminis TaxID=1548548 RepID=A0A2Z4FQN4_9DELT|nr:phosphoglycerate kinase [Bradymonas sediminis]AWV91263.1 phosphoglycerate kinase [Bradymonas sediminis]TDP73832.1 phosphoglycerate kinase [Bradymonas sediminis]
MDLTGIKFIDQIELAEKSILIRVDFNVPLDAEQQITDDTRIQAALPTIRYAMEQEDTKVILMSHLGRPKGKVDESLSLKPVGERLAEILGVEVLMPEDYGGKFVQKLISDMRNKQIMLLENLRFEPGEKGGDPAFGRLLSGLADVYINDAFGTSHRKHASMYHVAKYFDRYHKAAGFLVKNELEQISKLTSSPATPFTAIVGGAKVSDKLGVLNTLVERVDHLLIGGAMAYTFLKAKRVEVGNSLVEEDFVERAREIMFKATQRGVDLRLPVDHVVAASIDADADSVESSPRASIPKGMAGFDIGPVTIDQYKGIIADSKSIFWNGPMGVFEREPFANGTMSVAKAIAESDSFSVIGGGDSAAAINVSGYQDEISHISTGGGASLQMLEGKELPGIEALRANYPFEF